MYHTDDTIAAIASAAGGSARGIVRVSGPGLLTVLVPCFQPREPQDLATLRRPTLMPGMLTLKQSAIRELAVDIYLWPTARSYTRQPMAELHTIGSPPVLAAVLAALCQAGARLAEPGEFTLRAFLAGRIDLAQAEAVLGVIDARGPRELESALEQLAGGLTRPLHHLRESLVELLAHIEAGLDFVEEDIQFIAPAEIQRQLDDSAALVARIAAQLDTRTRRDVLPTAVLVGWPNVGKSSLFNALAGQAQALVANQPGTTRDYLTAVLDLDGVGCQLIDTAGLDDAPTRRASGEIERAAQRASQSQAARADVRLLCLDVTRPPNAWETQQLAANPTEPRLVLLTKCDGPRALARPEGAVETSVKLGRGLEGVRRALRQTVERLERSETAQWAAERSADSLRAAAESLDRAAALNRAGSGEELIAGELRVALDELGTIVGVVCTEDILERVFSRFCIGK